MHAMEYYSAIKRNEIELLVVRWKDLGSVIQSEVSQKEKNKYRMLTHIYGPIFEAVPFKALYLLLHMLRRYFHSG